MKIGDDNLRSAEWEVRDCNFIEAKKMVSELHYARGGSNTFVFCHGLFRVGNAELMGVAWWLPPTRVACESVNKEHWKKVLSLTRLVINTTVPKNAASFLLARSVKLIRNDGRFVTLVTYACESQNHTGAIYRASNWNYEGKTGPYPQWRDAGGKLTAQKATNNRTKKQMLELGNVMSGRYFKHKFVKHLK